MAVVNYASKYAKQVDERFHRESQAQLALSNEYKFTGVKTVNIYSIPVVGMNDYSRTGSSRYGIPDDLGNSVQSMTVNRDRSFTFVIDKGDKLQTQMVQDAGKALSRQLREVCVPEFDSYVFKTLADKAVELGHSSTTAATKYNAYKLFLDAMEFMGNHNVPEKGRVAFCTYGYANLLKQDSAFMLPSEAAKSDLDRGVIGEVDGCRIVKVPNGRLPAGTSFILTHPVAATAPRQLEDYKIHDDPPGINGWLVEGRLIYDCFVLDEKTDAIWYQGGQSGLKTLNIQTTKGSAGKSNVLVINGIFAGAKRYYMTATAASGLTEVTAGSAITVASWTELTTNPLEITPTSTHKWIRVVDVDSDNKPLAVGDSKLNIG